MTSNWVRTCLVILSIAVGIFAVGVVQHLSTVITGEMQRAYAISNGSHATLFTDGVDDDLLATLVKLPQVEAVQGVATLSLKLEVAPGQWEPITVARVPAYAEQQINKLQPVYHLDSRNQHNASQSSWPGRNQLALERSSLTAEGALPPGLAIGDTVRIEDATGKVRPLVVAGFLYDATGLPITFTGVASGFVDEETFGRLGGATTYNAVNLRVTGTARPVPTEDEVRAIADHVAAKIEKSGRTVQRVRVLEPGQLPLQDIFDAMTLILTPLGLLALVLGSFLVVNTMTALMAQQKRQIGMMKAVGADRGQLLRMYLGAVLIYSLAALAVALPLTLGVATLLEGVLGSLINLTLPGFVVPLDVLLRQIAIGLLVPALTALYPIWQGTTVTVREAISDHGVGNGHFGTSWFDRLLTGVRGLRRPLQLSLRNTFRRRGRLLLTLITLVMGGMIFMTVGSVRASLDERVAEVLIYNQFDLEVELAQTYRANKVEQVIRQMPGVMVVESWNSGQAVRVRANDTESNTFNLNALPPASVTIAPTLAAGRWLVPGDQNAIVLSQRIISEEPDLAVGDEITLEMDGKAHLWVVVGVVETAEFNGALNAFVPNDYFAHLTNSVHQVRLVRIQLTPAAATDVNLWVEHLTANLEQAGLTIADVETVEHIRTLTDNFFAVVILLLMVMGALIATVGAIGLTGTMSTNVLERTREIGVMRAIGAADGDVLQIVLVEGVVIGIISWGLGALLAFPVGYGLSSAVGMALFEAPLPYVFSAVGVFQWLILVLGLAAFASYLPARHAAQMTVRAALAYE